MKRTAMMLMLALAAGGCTGATSSAAADEAVGEAGVDAGAEVTRLPSEDEALAATEGTWLKADGLEVYVAHKPIMRVYVLRKAGGENKLLVPEHKYGGIRTCVMDPVQTINWDLPASEPAEVIEATDRTLRLRAEPSAEAQAQLELDVAIAEEGGQPAVVLTHRLINRSPESRVMAAWSIASLKNDGRMQVDYARVKNVMWDKEQIVRSVGLFDQAVAQNPDSFKFGERTLTVDTTADMSADSSKIGVVVPDGVVTYTTPEVTWTSRGPEHPGRLNGEGPTFPEGGYNVTFYKSWRPLDENWHYTELEHVAPLETLATGEASELRQVITLE